MLYSATDSRMKYTEIPRWQYIKLCFLEFFAIIRYFNRPIPTRSDVLGHLVNIQLKELILMTNSPVFVIPTKKPRIFTVTIILFEDGTCQALTGRFIVQSGADSEYD
jgi:hypothetical protein